MWMQTKGSVKVQVRQIPAVAYRSRLSDGGILLVGGSQRIDELLQLGLDIKASGPCDCTEQKQRPYAPRNGCGTRRWLLRGTGFKCVPNTPPSWPRRCGNFFFNETGISFTDS
jgi:hypothetical protein